MGDPAGLLGSIFEKAGPLVAILAISVVLFILGISEIPYVAPYPDGQAVLRALAPIILGAGVIGIGYSTGKLNLTAAIIIGVVALVLAIGAGLWKVGEGVREIQTSREIEDLIAWSEEMSTRVAGIDSEVDSLGTQQSENEQGAADDTTTATQVPETPEPTLKPPEGMVRIEGGTYVVGTNDLGTRSSASPRHEKSIETFWIHTTEVTNEDYAECVDAGTCTELSNLNSFNRNNYFRTREFKDFPVIWVTYFQARAYCTVYLNGSLPTEFEWEVAARGIDDYPYPWNEYQILPTDANLANPDSEFAVNDTIEVGSFVEDVSDFGILDMAGNVSEWTSSWFLPYPNSTLTLPGNERVVRGGSFSTEYDGNFPKVYARQHEGPTSKLADVGFRCAWRPESE